MAEARRDVPDDAWRHLEQAYTHDAAGAFEQALFACERAIELAPLLAEAHNLRGLVLEELDRRDEALEAYRRAFQLDPEFADARHNLSELQAELAAPHLERAWDLLVSGASEEALSACEAARAIAPAYARVHNLRGLALEELGRSAEAAEAYRQAIQLDPDLRDAVANLADLEAEPLREDGAGERVSWTAAPWQEREEVLPARPRSRRRWRTVLYGVVLVAIIACLLSSVLSSPRSYLNDPDTSRQALALFAWVLGLRPQNAEAYNRLGLDHHEQGELDRAIADYTRAIRVDPEFTAAYYNRALAHHELGELEQAISDLTRAIELAPGDANGYVSRGSIYHDQGRFAEAVADYSQAIALDPQHAVAYGDRGLAYHEQGDLDKALADYGRAIELDPEAAPLYYNRGLVHAEVGAQEEAVADFERFLELNEDPYWQEQAEEHLDALGER